MLALASAMGVGRFVYTPILPAMAATLGLRPGQAGLIASANFAGYLAGAILLTLAPIPAARRRAWLLAALLAGTALTAAMAVASSLPAFALIRFAGGAASAIVLVAGSAFILEHLAAAGAARLAPLHFAGVGAGIAASAILVSAMEAAGANWQALWAGAGGLSLVVIPLVAAWTRTPALPPPPAQAPAGALPGILWRLALCHLLFGFGYIVTATFLVAAVRTSAAAAVEPLVWLLVGLTAAPSVALWTRIAARIGTRQAYALAAAIEAVGVMAGGVSRGAAGALIAAALLGVTFMGLTALGFAAARTVVPPPGLGRAFALMTVGFGAGQAAGPLAAGLLFDRTGSFAAPSMLAAMALCAAAALVLWPTPTPKSPPTSLPA